MSSQPVTGKYSRKPYSSRCCGAERLQGTNHWGAIYNTQCPKCCQFAVWDCQEPVPEGMGVPEEWKTVTLGDLMEVRGDGP